MAITALSIIGETINDSVPSTKKLFDAEDIAGLLELARFQDQQGAACIDVNVGPRSPQFMADMVRKIQGVTGKPLSIDTPDPEIARAGLAAYDPASPAGSRRFSTRSPPCAGRCSNWSRSAPSGRSCWSRNR